MPFDDNLPAENTDPWYTPMVTAWGNLKTFVNGLETALGTKVNSSTYTSGMAGKVDALNGATGLWIGTQAEYDAITTPDPAVAYFVVG